MPRYNSYVDITGIEDDTIAMRIEIEDRVFKDCGPPKHCAAYDALTPYMNDLERFLEIARQLVHIVKSSDLDYEEPVVDDDLSEIFWTRNERIFD